MATATPQGNQPAVRYTQACVIMGDGETRKITLAQDIPLTELKTLEQANKVLCSYFAPSLRHIGFDSVILLNVRLYGGKLGPTKYATTTIEHVYSRWFKEIKAQPSAAAKLEFHIASKMKLTLLMESMPHAIMEVEKSKWPQSSTGHGPLGKPAVLPYQDLKLLKKSNRQLRNKNVRLVDEVAELKEKVGGLEKEKADLKEENGGLENKVAELEERIADLLREKALNADISRRYAAEMERKVTKLENKIESMREERKEWKSGLSAAYESESDPDMYDAGEPDEYEDDLE
ncbi:uncharacterized protein AB675_2959 [Cyphellophora attinorum]|uniref:Uncharacterized protein n=1 Tax=Cyphellophora attinorum TaxID=1664694 RepID=A0A0N1NYW4_9EURO|nr:uncharacterized protein AB675_2959 [Phialophora attinorum]KPI36367.1 hypothetical protein AB675_2959 [Phialophora attinorum]